MNKQHKRYIFIGAAWPYANAPLHLGHIASLLPADIIARYYRLKGDNVLFVSGSDCHGTPIVLAAEKEKKSPDEIAQFYHKEFKKTLIDGFDFSYDNYTTTLTENHTKVVQEFFTKLYEKKDIEIKKQKLPFCSNCQRFLPDRYIEGKCPKCGFESARGDQCDQCGQMLDPEDLIDPKCQICNSTPIFKETEHFFLKLSQKEKFIKDLVDSSSGWRKNAIGFTNKLLNEGLKDRAITRDTSWGVDIPLGGYENKKIYVWFDAVCGYYSASLEALNKTDELGKYWENSEARHYYVHGKDNIPFHTIIWPIMLKGFGNLKLPDYIVSSEYLTLEKKQFSKSRDWAIWAKDITCDFNSDYLRFYLILNGPETSDSDFDFYDFQSRINSELIGNFGNFINRTTQLIERNFKNGIEINQKSQYLQTIEEIFENTGKLIEEGNLREALKQVLKIAEDGNKYLSQQEPWKKIKDHPQSAQNILANCAKAIICLQTLISPFLPKSSQKIANIFDNNNRSTWQYPDQEKFLVKKTEIIFQKIEKEQIEAQITKLKGGTENKQV